MNLTAAVIGKGDLHYWVFMICDVDCRLELERKCSFASQEREPESQVSDEWSVPMLAYS